jgi:hypothetical protein
MLRYSLHALHAPHLVGTPSVRRVVRQIQKFHALVAINLVEEGIAN